jgi:hypothetical protein
VKILLISCPDNHCWCLTAEQPKSAGYSDRSAASGGLGRWRRLQGICHHSRSSYGPLRGWHVWGTHFKLLRWSVLHCEGNRWRMCWPCSRRHGRFLRCLGFPICCLFHDSCMFIDSLTHSWSCHHQWSTDCSRSSPWWSWTAACDNNLRPCTSFWIAATNFSSIVFENAAYRPKSILFTQFIIKCKW